MSKIRARVLIKGIVQGVFFRQTTMQQALSHGVNGWVRNLPDGRVEALFEGEEEAVKALVDFCKKGPRGASVTDIAVNWEPFKEQYKEFQIIH